MEAQNETHTENLDLPRIVVLSKDKAWAWTLMPELLERIGRFAEKYMPDTLPSVLINSVMADFVKIQSGFFILAALEDFKIIGHLLACISIPPWSERRRLLVLQYETDPDARMPRGLLEAGLDLLVDIAKTHYCSEIIAETKTKEMTQVFTRLYGFTLDMTQVKKAV